MPFLIVFAAAFLVALLLTPAVKQLSHKWGLLAQPGGRRQHAAPIPKLGGLAVFGGWLVGIALVYWLMPPMEQADQIRLRGVILGSLIMVAGGIIDDWRDLRPWQQLLIQFTGAALAMSHLIFIEVFTNPFGAASFWNAAPLAWFVNLEGSLVWIWRPLALLFTLFWVVGMINAINWLDGLDGLAAGVCTIAALMLAWHSYRLGQSTVALFPIALAGALLGFLPFNFAPARIFLGTAGAYFLGYQVATLSILSPAKLSTALLVLAVPILDVAWQIVDRIRRGQNPLQGDRRHLHFRLSDGGLPTRQIVIGYYVVALAFGLIAIFAPSGLFKLVMWLALGAVVSGFFVWLGRKPTRQ